MTLSPPKGISLRPYLPRDLPRLISLFKAAVEELAADDYDEAQRAAWLAAVEDEARFGARLEPLVTLVAEAMDQITGFIALKNNDTIELLYIQPAFARRGIATFLCQAVELLAQGRKSSQMTVMASDTAQPLFQRLGYTPTQRNTVALYGQWLTNTTMQKPLTAETGTRN